MARANGPGLLDLLMLVCRVCLGIVFVYAGVMKIMDPAGFAQAIANYRILPAAMTAPTAIILPWAECLSGLCMVLGLFLPGASLLVAGLLLVFALALGIDLLRGLDISCGCFGASKETITWLYVLRDAALCGMACLVWARSQRSLFALDGVVSGTGTGGNSEP